MNSVYQQLGELQLNGWLGPDTYSTAWVALVPDRGNPNRPQWPEALDYLRTHQLDDGGWGDPTIYYAHGRTIATMAAIWALKTWSNGGEDNHRVARAAKALNDYAKLLQTEPHDPIGFELLLPRIRVELQQLNVPLPDSDWSHLDSKRQAKQALIKTFDPQSQVTPRTWWFSMELLPESKLAELNDISLDRNGAIASSTAATAAYLRARRRSGHESTRAAEYLRRLVTQGAGAAPVGWPFDVFEQVWALDSLMRADLDPKLSSVSAFTKRLNRSWHKADPGLAFGDDFPVNDGDDTLVGFSVLKWAGLAPKPAAVLTFWDGDHFTSYLDERSTSVSVNIHGLAALRAHPSPDFLSLAGEVTRWLMEQRHPTTLFDDKWHLSPLYSVSHALPAFAGWDDAIALDCLHFLLSNQHADGGWGWSGISTLEETAHCTLALYQAVKSNLLTNLSPLIRANEYFLSNAKNEAVEHLWIGKTLYRPQGIVEATILAARLALSALPLAQQQAA